MAIDSNLTNNFLDYYNGAAGFIPENFRILLPLALIAITITVYSMFIWFFYRFLARRDILQVDFKKYDEMKFAGLRKFFAFIFYIIKFIIAAPVVIFLWFALFSLLFIILAKDLTVPVGIIISAGLISAIRITSYISEDLSKDLAKMFPFTLLGIVILSPGFLNIETTFARITEIPLLFNNLLYYLIFIIVLESALRLLYMPFAAFSKGKKE